MILPHFLIYRSSSRIRYLNGSSLSTSPGHYRIELLLTDQPIVVRIRTLNHLLQLCVVDGLTYFLHHSPQILYRDETCLLVVEKGEDFGQTHAAVAG